MKKLFIALLLIVPGLSLSDGSLPSSDCERPTKPGSSASEQKWKAFYDAAQTYQACMQEFINTQKNELKRHENAVNQAVKEWNSFVEQELQ